jgi:hypothetical protein
LRNLQFAVTLLSAILIQSCAQVPNRPGDTPLRDLDNSRLSSLPRDPSSFQGGSDRGGGNRIGLEAAAALKLVPMELKRLGTDLVTANQLREIEELANSKNTLIVVVDQAPISCAGGIEQKGTAYSSNGESFRLIQIYKNDWLEMRGNLEQEIPFMAHEAGVLKGWERTGAYGAISAELKIRLQKSGVAPEATSSLDLLKLGTVQCGLGSECVFAVQAGNLESCQKFFRTAYKELSENRKVITYQVTCGEEIRVISRPGKPDQEYKSGLFTGRITFH